MSDAFYIPNKLVEAGYSMSLLGLRLRSIALSKLNLRSYQLGFVPPIIISVEEWQHYFPNSEQPYRDLKRALESFGNAVVRFEGSEKEYKFLKHYEYLEGEGKVLLEFCPEFLMACR